MMDSGANTHHARSCRFPNRAIAVLFRPHHSRLRTCAADARLILSDTPFTRKHCPAPNCLAATRFELMFAGTFNYTSTQGRNIYFLLTAVRLPVVAGGDEFEVRVAQRKLDVLKWVKRSSVSFLMRASG
jgi:hypothetical protein